MTKRVRDKRGKFTKPNTGEWHEPFLAGLAATGSVRAAASLAQIERRTAYKAREEDPEFAAQWKQAKRDAIDMLEVEARSRALKQSDYLLWKLLCSLKPRKFVDRVRVEDRELNARFEKALEELRSGLQAGSAQPDGTNGSAAAPDTTVH